MLKNYWSIIFSCVICTLPVYLSGCGFQLRGLETVNAPIISQQAKQVMIDIEDNRTAFLLKQTLNLKLQTLGIKPLEITRNPIDKSQFINQIHIQNIQFQKYELLGTLTEIRLILSANIHYSIINPQGKISNITAPLQVERSYQYNKASVGVEDQQGEQIRQWLYQALAQQITDQYFALNQP